MFGHSPLLWRIVGALSATIALWGVVQPGLADQRPEARVVIVHGPQRIYKAAATSLQASLQANRIDSTSIVLPSASDSAGRELAAEKLADAAPTIIACGGRDATAWALETIPSAAVVFFMVPNALDAEFAAPDYAARSRVAGVAADASPEKRIALIKDTAPKAKRVAILCSARTELTTEAIKAAGEDQGITVTAVTASEDGFIEALDRLNSIPCEGVLMIPDSRIYNGRTVQRLLLWGLRKRKAVWSFSPNAVKAGAFAGISVDVQSVGEMAADLVARVIGGEPVGELGVVFTDELDVAVNLRTAKMINTDIDKSRIGAEATYYGGGR